LTVSSICPAVSGYTLSVNCEDDPVLIQCTAGNVIYVLCSFYGIDPVLNCPRGYLNGAQDMCYTKTSSDTIFTRCHGKSSCSFSPTESNFLVICPGYGKIIVIQYKCVTSGLATTTTTTTPSPTTTTTTAQLQNQLCQVYSQDQCPVYSKYYPQSVATSTVTSFGEPIYEQVICDGGI
jgi:hypothetical protein